jgi:hypothetical protein
MIEALVILALVSWTFFGFVALFNVPIEDLKPSLRLALVVGPMITIGFAMIIVGLAIVEKVVGWVKNA